MVVGAGAGAAAMIPGCGPGLPGGDGGRTDAGASPEAGCAQAVGPPSGFTIGNPVAETDLFGNPFYVVRDSAGIFALSAICTHAGCAVDPNGGSGYICPCHCATFDAAGNVTGGPAFSPLVHFACTLMKGQVCVDTSTIVAQSVRLKA